MKKLIFVLFFIFYFFSAYSQNVFSSLYYTNFDPALNNFSRANSVLCTSDGNFVVAGLGNSGTKISALKLDINGDTIWSYVTNFGDISSNRLCAVTEAYDDGIVVAGVSTNFNGDYPNALLIKFDKRDESVIFL